MFGQEGGKETSGSSAISKRARRESYKIPTEIFNEKELSISARHLNIIHKY